MCALRLKILVPELNQFSLPRNPNLLSVGFDVGGTNIRGLSLGNDGGATELYQRQHLGNLELIVDSVVEISTQMQISSGKKIGSIGVGCAGLVDKEGVVITSPNIQTIEKFPLRKEIQERMQVAVVVENDANCAAWAEAQLGVAKGKKDLIVVSFGTGIGAGILLNGQLHKGISGYAGEVGHMVIEREGLPCPCGKQGCWEQYASGSALGRLANQMQREGLIGEIEFGLVTEGNPLSSEAVGAAVQGDDPEAIKVLSIYSEFVSMGLHNLTKMIDPEMIVLSGGITEIGSPFLEAIKQSYYQITDTQPNSEKTEIALARFGNKAGSVGAAIFGNQIM